MLLSLAAALLAALAILVAPRAHPPIIKPGQKNVPDYLPAWSPDGHWIAFKRGDGFIATTVRGSRAWSSAGHRFAWVRRWKSIPMQLAYAYHSDVFLARADGSLRKRFARGDDFAWAPNGSRVAILRIGKLTVNEELVILSRTGHEIGRPPERCVNGCAPPVIDEWPVWSPNSQWLAFNRVSNPAHGSGPGAYDLYVVRSDGSGLRRLSTGLIPFEWSPDSRRIAGTNGRFAIPRVAIVALSGNGQELIARGTQPSWSTNGRWIAFRGGWPRAGGDARSLYLIRPDGMDRRVLGSSVQRCSSIAECFSARWSPDGRRLVFSRAGRVWVARGNGSSPRAVAEGADPTWSPDGRFLAFASSTCGRRQGIYVLDVATSELRRVSNHCSIYGTGAGDTIRGTAGRDSIAAHAGNDLIDARGGDRDYISCGEGEDVVRADSTDRINGDCERVKAGA